MFQNAGFLRSLSGADLLLRHAPAAGTARGIVLVQHGLAEHSGRYGRFAGELSALGFHVFAQDHRGHGGTRATDAPPRRFAARDGAECVLADLSAVEGHARTLAPSLPIILFGHSMGGHIALAHAIRSGSGLAGLAVWNASFDAGPQLLAGRAALRIERALKGSDVASAVFAGATFNAWARSVPDARTPADWLSHDRQAVEAYVADPLCGWTPTVSMASDLLDLVASGAAGIASLPDALPLHLLGGGEDPATKNGAAVERLAARARHRGSRDVTLTIVAGARHETLNESEAHRQPAMASLTGWLDRVIP